MVLIGDHHQLPPVVKNVAFQKYGRLDQSLFARFVRLGTPGVQLNAQGRCRPSIAQLFSWRYAGLANLPAVTPAAGGEYALANPGLGLEFQLIDVPDYGGRGESTPSPFFYQNLGEAEYVVALFMYLRLLGYAGGRIAILATYNGQKHLIRDVLARRCAPFPFFGLPAAVTTVDRFQGQQADIVLLSLVRTRAVGHLRDVRRLVVALSRARLGLYVFARASLFANVVELAPAFTRLRARPTRLMLVEGESLAAAGRPGAPPPTRRPAAPADGADGAGGVSVSEESVAAAAAAAGCRAHAVPDVTAMGELVHSMAQAMLRVATAGSGGGAGGLIAASE